MKTSSIAVTENSTIVVHLTRGFLCKKKKEIDSAWQKQSVLFLFKQMFKMASKNVRKASFGKHIAEDSRGKKKLFEFALSCTISEINAFWILSRNSRWPPKMARNFLL